MLQQCLDLVEVDPGWMDTAAPKDSKKQAHGQEMDRRYAAHLGAIKSNPLPPRGPKYAAV